MTYYNNNGLIIRPIERRDCAEIPNYFEHKPESRYLRYLEKQERGGHQVLLAEKDGRFAGYLLLAPQAEHGPFAGAGLPEIEDFNVAEYARRRGIGSLMLDVAEREAAKLADVVTLGVGLHSGYGAAQRLYVKRGYLPDGSGVWYRNSVCPEYSPCCNDDDLVLYLSKKLR